MVRTIRMGMLVAIGGTMLLAGGVSSRGLAQETRETTPGLKVGETVPAGVSFVDIHGEKIQLSDMYRERPVVVTFYRGGWCPYCTKALAGWEKAMDEMEKAGVTFIAITPEKPEYIEKTSDKYDLSFEVMCDPDNSAAEAFEVLFSLDEGTKKKYEGYGINLARNNASGEWMLPAPGTFVIDTNGVVQFAFADWDYKKRADPDDVLAAVHAVLNADPAE